jgi:hypothetical protein
MAARRSAFVLGAIKKSPREQRGRRNVCPPLKARRLSRRRSRTLQRLKLLPSKDGGNAFRSCLAYDGRLVPCLHRSPLAYVFDQRKFRRPSATLSGHAE